MPSEQKEVVAEYVRPDSEGIQEISQEPNQRVEIIYLPEGILTDRRKSGLHLVPADVLKDRRGSKSAPEGKHWSRRLNIAFWAFSAIALVFPAVLTAYFGIGIHPVVTGSMRPTFQIGDLIISKIEPVSQVKVGEVILLLSPVTGEMQAHRVISKTTSGDSITFVTKGDANPANDAPVKMVSITMVRHITSVVPKLGKVITAFSSKTLRNIVGIPFIAISLVIVSIQMVRRLVRRRRDDRKQSNANPTNRK